jgi:hypothetical protein
VVLFADDEDAIRWLGRRFLEADGWAVLDQGNDQHHR